MCEDPRRTSRTRLLSSNSAFLLTFLVNTSLRENVGCRQGCREVLVPENKNVSIDNNLLFLMGSLCLSDLLAECLVHSSSIRPLALLSASSRYSVRGTTAFCVLHIGPVLGVFCFHRLVYVHTSLAGTPCLLDIVQVLVHKPVIKQSTQKQVTEPPREMSAETPDAGAAQRLQPGAAQRLQMPLSNKPFEVDSRSRRKFMMTFTGRSRWPAVRDVPAQKKTT